MTTRCLKRLMIAGLIAGFAGAAQAEDFDIGKSEFQPFVLELSWYGWKGQRACQRPAQDTAFRFDHVGQEQQRRLSHDRCL